MRIKFLCMTYAHYKLTSFHFCHRINVVHSSQRVLRTFPNPVHELHFFWDDSVSCFNLVIKRI